MPYYDTVTHICNSSVFWFKGKGAYNTHVTSPEPGNKWLPPLIYICNSWVLRAFKTPFSLSQGENELTPHKAPICPEAWLSYVKCMTDVHGLVYK